MEREREREREGGEMWYQAKKKMEKGRKQQSVKSDEEI